MADKLMYVQCTTPIMKNNITPLLDYNYWLRRLDTQLNESTNQIQ